MMQLWLRVMQTGREIVIFASKVNKIEMPELLSIKQFIGSVLYPLRKQIPVVPTDNINFLGVGSTCN